jgi:putative ABC transport system substrate-binding protein
LIDRRTVLVGTGAVLLAGPLAAEAQQAENVPRIGILYSGLSGASPSVLEGFRQGLRERGYVEPKSIAIEWRFDDGHLARLPNLAAELVRLKVDVIVAIGERHRHNSYYLSNSR